jgi:lipoprotein-releasing system permease protein
MDALTLFLAKSSLHKHGNRKLRFDYLLMILGIIISVTVVCAAINLFEGYEKTLKKVILDSNSNIIIYSAFGQPLTPEQAEETRNILSKDSRISSIRRVYSNTAMIQSGGKIRSSLIRAYPLSEDQDIWFGKYVISGNRTLSKGNIIIGEKLARDLSVNPGDRISLMYPQTENPSQIGLLSVQKEFMVGGIVKTGHYEMDKTLIIMTTDDAFGLYDIAPRYSHLEVNLTGKYTDKADKVASGFQQLLGNNYQVDSWIDYNGNLFSLITVEKWLIFLVFSFLILIAALNCVSIVSTLILERKKEIAILRTLGMSIRKVRNVIFLRTFGVSLMSILAGLVLGAAAAWLITQQTFYQLKGDVYFIDKITMHISAINYLAVFVLSVLLVSLCIRVPLKYINRLEIIDVLRGI